MEALAEGGERVAWCPGVEEGGAGRRGILWAEREALSPASRDSREVASGGEGVTRDGAPAWGCGTG